MGISQSVETNESNQFEQEDTKKHEVPNYFGALSDDIAIIVLSFLNYRTLLRVSQVNKRLKQLANEPQL